MSLPGPVLVVDYGAQYAQLIARRVREARVYSEIIPHTTSVAEIVARRPSALVLSGGPESVYVPGAPKADPSLFSAGIPVLGICYGLQAMAVALGGAVGHTPKGEFGRTEAEIHTAAGLLAGLPAHQSVWMSHRDAAVQLPPGFVCTASTEGAPIAAFEDPARRLFAVQWHPEVVHTDNGQRLIENFLYRCAGIAPTWTTGSIIDASVKSIADLVGSHTVIAGLSGGVDSAVAAALVQRAVGEQLTCVFVDNGLLRRDEGRRVVEVMSHQRHINLVHVDATDRFLTALAGVTDPEEKRRRIGRTFIEVFETEARRLGDIDFLAQGTLYPDVIESTSHDTPNARTIKTHHNVGGLPADLRFQLVEPLRYLFKDEVRRVGTELGLPEDMVWRQPFPGPGLAIRVIGEVTRERLEVLRAADWIVIDEVKRSGLYRKVWQSFAILTPISSVGVMGDGRTYANVVAIRIVESDDAMTADWARVPYDVLGLMSRRIVNEVAGVNRVVYDISSKPPSTIEWE